MKKFLISILMGISMNAFSEPVKIETDSFLLVLPSGWKIEELSKQAKIVGPNEEYLIVSSYRINGEGKNDDLEAIRKKFNENIYSSMSQGASEPDLKIVEPLVSSPSKNGYTVLSVSTETKDQKKFYNLYGTVGPRVALLLTIEGDISHRDAGKIVLEALHNIQWQ